MQEPRMVMDPDTGRLVLRDKLWHARPKVVEPESTEESSIPEVTAHVRGRKRKTGGMRRRKHNSGSFKVRNQGRN